MKDCWSSTCFISCTLGRCSSKLAYSCGRSTHFLIVVGGLLTSLFLWEVYSLPYSCGRSTHYSDRLHNFSIIIPRCFKDVYVNVNICICFFHHTAWLWNSLPIECFPFTYDLNGVKSRINTCPLTIRSF